MAIDDGGGDDRITDVSVVLLVCSCGDSSAAGEAYTSC